MTVERWRALFRLSQDGFVPQELQEALRECLIEIEGYQEQIRILSESVERLLALVARQKREKLGQEGRA
jgi:hypothetical protein